MQKRFKHVGALLALCLIFADRPRPVAASAFIGATEVTQVLNHVQLVARYLQAAQHLISTLNQEAMMIKNLTQMSFHSFSAIANDLNALGGVVQGANAIAYSAGQMDRMFAQQFPGFAQWNAAHPIFQDYQSWSNTHMATIQGSLRAAGYQASMLNNEQTLIDTLRQKAQNPQGAMQVMGLMGEIADQQVTQLQSLRQLMIQDMTMKATYQGVVQQQHDAQIAAAQAWSAPLPASGIDGGSYIPNWR